MINLPPTFGMYAFDTRLNAGQVIEIRRARRFFARSAGHPRRRSPSRTPKVFFLTSPNNPDGSLPARPRSGALLELPVLVVIDEAYIEFTSQAAAWARTSAASGRCRERENLVVLRTFTKWAGLAGLRVGYGAFPDWLLPALWKAKQPYNVNVAASAAAIASLEDLDYLAGNVARLRAERERLYDGPAGDPLPAALPLPGQFYPVPGGRPPGRRAEARTAATGDPGALLQHPAAAGLYPRSAWAGRKIPMRVLARCAAKLPARTVRRPPSQRARPGSTARRTKREFTCRSGTGRRRPHQIHTGLPFLDHMLAQIAVHGLFDLEIEAQGDLEIDPHHTMEDVALALGQAFAQALGDRAGIVRMASFDVPMDESLALGGRRFLGPALRGDPGRMAQPERGRAAGHPVRALSGKLRRPGALHPARARLYGRDDHHQAEALFKALARALAAAVALDPRRAGQVPSSKGVL